MTAVITAIFGSYDAPKTHPADDSIDWVLVTDDYQLHAPGWRIVHWPFAGKHPRMAAKYPKCLPQLFTQERSSLWIDGSVVLRDLSLIDAATEAMHNDIAFFGHPERDCIYEEADVSTRMLKYEGQPVSAQVEHYWNQHAHPEGWGLWAAGIIMRRHTAPIAALGCAWLAEQHEWSYQDQLSLPVVLREHEISPGIIPGNLWRNPWFTLAEHRSER